MVFDGNSKIVTSVIDSWQPTQSLKTLVDNVWGTHGINGWFFCPNEAAYSRCAGNTTDLLRKSNGILYSKWQKDIWIYKSVFWFDINDIAWFVNDDGTYKQDLWVDAIYNGLAMPTLLKDWVNVAKANSEMNSDPKQGAAWNKTFICSIQDKSTIYMWYVDGVTFSSLADYIIQTFGCYNAILLDNGWSKAMMYDRTYVAGPWRNIMDAFVIVDGDNIWPFIVPADQWYTADELKTAITRMYSAWLTKYNTSASFHPFSTMTRQQAAKFFGVFATNEFHKTETIETCSFHDLNTADPTLGVDIIHACKLGIFRWSNWNFLPNDTLTNAQAITVLMRVLVGMLPEPDSAFYINYLTKAKEMGLVKDIKINENISRWQAAMLLYKAHIYNSNGSTN